VGVYCFFVSMGVYKGKGRCTRNSLDLYGGLGKDRRTVVVDIYSCLHRELVSVFLWRGEPPGPGGVAPCFHWQNP